MSQARFFFAPADSHLASLVMPALLLCLVPRTANAVGVKLISPADGATLTDPFPELQWDVDPGECSGWEAHAEGDLVDGTPEQVQAAFGGNPIRAPCGHGWHLGGGGVSGSGVVKVPSPVKGPGTFRWRVHWVCMLPLRPTGSQVPGLQFVPVKGPREFFTEYRTFTIGQCAAKFTFMQGDIKVNGGPPYDIVTVENQPHRAPKEIHEGDTIETGQHSRAEITLQDHSVIRLVSETKVKFGHQGCGRPEDCGRPVSINLIRNNFWAKVFHMVSPSCVEERLEAELGVCGGELIKLPSGRQVYRVTLSDGGTYDLDEYDSEGKARCETGGGVRGSTMEASYDVATSTLRIRVNDGHGYIRSNDKEVELQAGFCSTAKAGEPPVAPYRCKPFFEWK